MNQGGGNTEQIASKTSNGPCDATKSECHGNPVTLIVDGGSVSLDDGRSRPIGAGITVSVCKLKGRNLSAAASHSGETRIGGAARSVIRSE